MQNSHQDHLGSSDLTAESRSKAPVAWMWRYIGNDPIGAQIKPCARSLHEMDPNNPPYPNYWKPIYPLFKPSSDSPASSGTSQSEQDRLDAERYRWLRDSGKYSPAWSDHGWGLAGGTHRYSAAELDAAVDAARAALKEPSHE
jgi:hypothetical protein